MPAISEIVTNLSVAVLVIAVVIFTLYVICEVCGFIAGRYPDFFRIVGGILGTIAIICCALAVFGIGLFDFGGWIKGLIA